jgi:ABC-type transport system involved in Fe-S cluster assembly fused permease/ATPase subunit
MDIMACCFDYINIMSIVLLCFRRAYGSWFHISNLVFYLIFLALFTVLVTTCTFSFRDASSKNNSTINETDNTAHINTCHVSYLWKMFLFLFDFNKRSRKLCIFWLILVPCVLVSFNKNNNMVFFMFPV